MAVVVEQGGELYGLMVDEVGEVMSLTPAQFERNPSTLDAELGRASHRHLSASTAGCWWCWTWGLAGRVARR